MQESINQKRKKIVHEFAKWTALSALRSGSPLKRIERFVQGPIVIEENR